MTEELFYHYTNRSSAKAIFLSGKILPSLRANGDAVHGDGVYLTTLDPVLGKDTVGENNWDGMIRHHDDKMECYFEILMPSSNVRHAREKRNIQIYEGELILANYKWSLKDWDGDLLATQYFMVSSEDEAAEVHPNCMGRYSLCTYTLDFDTPVYKHDETNMFLYRDVAGSWNVGDVDYRGFLVQYSYCSPSPHKAIPWLFVNQDKDYYDYTLRVYPCY